MWLGPAVDCREQRQGAVWQDRRCSVARCVGQSRGSRWRSRVRIVNFTYSEGEAGLQNCAIQHATGTTRHVSIALKNTARSKEGGPALPNEGAACCHTRQRQREANSGPPCSFKRIPGRAPQVPRAPQSATLCCHRHARTGDTSSVAAARTAHHSAVSV